MPEEVKRDAETVSHCYVAFDQGHISEAKLKDLLRQAETA
jgi:hypothetical protein